MVNYSELSDYEIREISLKELRKFPLFNESHFVQVSRDEDDVLFIGYRTNERSPFGKTHFDLQTDGEICYLVDVELEKSERGKGLGKKLYEVTEEIARNIGCSKMRQYPSGTTFNGKTRKDYVQRKLGYKEIPHFSHDVEKVL